MTTTEPEAQTTLILMLQSLSYTPDSVKRQLAPEFEELALWLIDTGNQQTQAIMTEVKEIKLTNERKEIPNLSKK